MATNGKLEAQITVPSIGWDILLDDATTAATAINIPAGTYYHSSPGSEAESLADTFATLANAVMNETWTCTVAAGEGGTGKYTISCTGATCVVSPDITDVLVLMGFEDDLVGGELTGSTSYTSTDQAKNLWLPDYPFESLNGGPAWKGWWETDQQNRENSNGNAFSIIGRKKQINSVSWNFASRGKNWQVNEVIGNESFEQFLLDGIWAEAAWGTSAGPIRFYGDADDDATFATYAAFGLEDWMPSQVRPGWVHGWVVVLPRLIKVPD